MPGIITTYTEFADAHVARFEERGKPRKISRAKVEYQILREINNANLLVDCKLSWTHAILNSQLFDALWDSISRRLKLPKSCTARYVPDPTLIQFEAPSDDEAEEGVKEADGAVGDENESRQSSPDIVSSASGSGEADASASRSPEPVTDPSSIVRDEDSRDAYSEAEFSAHEERDSSYEEPSGQRKKQAKAKTSAKAGSKPRGVKKHKTAQKKAAPAQLKTAAAIILESVQQSAAEIPSATPEPTATTSAPVSNNNNPTHPSPTAPPLATPTPNTSTTNPPATHPTRAPYATDRPLPPALALQYNKMLKRMQDFRDEKAQASKKVKTGADGVEGEGGRAIASVRDGGRQIATMREGTGMGLKRSKGTKSL